MMGLAFISLSAPAMLAGLALLALPVAAHLLNRRAKRRLVFPSIVLLAQTQASQSTLFKLRRLLLLLLRCAAVLAIVLAFTQPLWLDAAAASGTQREDAATVVVLDASASTAQQVGGAAGDEQLRAAASRALADAAARGDAMNVVVASGRPRVLFPQMTRNDAALRSAAESVEPGVERADLAAALAEAGKLLAAQRGERRLVVLSDLQATNWGDLRSAAPLPERTGVTLVPLDAAPADNLAVAAVRTVPALPMAGRATQAVATVANFGERDAVAHVELLLDDTPVAAGEVLVEPWQQREVALPVTLDIPGQHRLTVRLREDDGLAADNVRHHVARAVERRTVVVIADDDPEDAETSAYFLTRAVAPRGDARDATELRVVRSADLDAVDLRDAAALFVGYAGELPPPALAAIADYVKGGGGAVLFCGSGPVDRNLAALDKLDPHGLLPFRVAGLRDLADEGDALAIAHGNWRAPLLRAFDARSQEAFAHARFTRVWAADEPHAESTVLLRFGDGSPAMAERGVGRGRVVLAAFSPDPAASDLPKHGSFVALVQSLVEELEPRGTLDAPSPVGSALRLATSKANVGGNGLEVVGPGEQPVAFDASAPGDDVVALVPHAARPGFYELRLRDTPLALAAAALDPRESDLRRIDLATAQAMLGRTGATVALGSATSDDEGDHDLGRPLWGWLLLAALGLVAIELGLLGYWRR